MRDRFAGVLGCTRKREGLWAVESSAGADLAGDLSVGSLQGGFFGVGSFLGGSRGFRTYSIQIPISAALPFLLRYYNHHHHHHHRRIANRVGSINYPSKLVLAPFGFRSCRKGKRGVDDIVWRWWLVVVTVLCFRWKEISCGVNDYVGGRRGLLRVEPCTRRAG